MDQILAVTPYATWTDPARVALPRRAQVAGLANAGLSLPVRDACLVARAGRHDIVLTPPDGTAMLAVAPAAGIVVRVAEKDRTTLATHIVLRLGDDSHLTLGRVIAGSVLVAVGETVRPGAPLARFGPAPMLMRRHDGVDPGGRARPIRLGPHAAHGNGGPRWILGAVPGREVALLQPFWPKPGQPEVRLSPAQGRIWTIDPVGKAAARFVCGRAADAVLSACLDLAFPAAPPAWTVGLWWRHDPVAGPAWRRLLARFWAPLRVRSFATVVAVTEETAEVRVRVAGGDLPRVLRMEFGPNGLRRLYADFADGVLSVGLAGGESGHGSTTSPGQTACQRVALAS